MIFTPYNTPNHIRSTIEIERWYGTAFDTSGAVSNLQKEYTIFCPNGTSDMGEIDIPVVPYPLPSQTSKNLIYYKIQGNTGRMTIGFNAYNIPYIDDDQYSLLRSIDGALPTNKFDGLSYVKVEQNYLNRIANSKNSFNPLPDYYPVQTHGNMRDFILNHVEPIPQNRYFINIYDKKWDAEEIDDSQAAYGSPKKYKGILTKATATRNSSGSNVSYVIVLSFLIGDNFIKTEIQQEDEGGNIND